MSVHFVPSFFIMVIWLRICLAFGLLVSVSFSKIKTEEQKVNV